MKHPHADLIKQMVDDDTLRATNDDGTIPSEFEMWQVCAYPQQDWRLVPPKPKTITIVCNGKTYELPEPMRVAPEKGTEYFVYDHDCAYKQEWLGTYGDVDKLDESRCHTTREAAQQWVDAMAEIRGAK